MDNNWVDGVSEALSQLNTSEQLYRLHEILNSSDIEELYKLFQASEKKKFESGELRDILDEKLKITYTDEEFTRLFSMLNVTDDKECDWHEFVAYLILGFRDDDPKNQKASLKLPIMDTPLLKKSHHWHPILRVGLSPAVRPDRSINYTNGSYYTASKDGTINFWTLDFELLRSCKSTNPMLKTSQTWILDTITLPDVKIICTSSSERDLRFYDTTANNFILRIIITTVPLPINTMYYSFTQDVATDCQLFLGDRGGNIRILSFNANLRGPFQSGTGPAIRICTYRDLLAGKFPGIKVTEFLGLHEDIVRQIGYFPQINSFISCAECPETVNLSTTATGLIICGLGVQKSRASFKAHRGMSCFCYDYDSDMIATGGPDCIIRLWNPIVPKKPKAALSGHPAGIIYIFIQDNGKLIYSIDKNKIINIWETEEYNLMQTFVAFTPLFHSRSPIVIIYNEATRDVIFCGMKIGQVKCAPLLKLEITDGDTHSKPVSIVLYNNLYKCVVTCGFDSIIMVWDVFTGKRLNLIRPAHSRMLQGKKLRVELTAGCFDPKHQLLLTGARDGTMKIWNFKNGDCVRNLAIEEMCEVTGLHWVPNRILAVGWNKHVTEFAIGDVNSEYGSEKLWDVCHVEDILSSAVKEGETIATASYSGELILWKFETGQPYKRFNVQNPTAKIKMAYYRNKFVLPVQEDTATTGGPKRRFYQSTFYKTDDRKSVLNRKKSVQQPSRKSVAQVGRKSTLSMMARRKSTFPDTSTLSAGDKWKILRARRLSVIQLPSKLESLRNLTIHSCLFLSSRPMTPQHGTLLVALENGVIQVYSHHNFGGYMDQFNAVHIAGDCVMTMATDADNYYLFIGTALGYIKIWVISNFCKPEAEQQRIVMPRLRLKFPFLSRDIFDGRAKRTAREIKNPVLVNSWRAHLRTVNSLVYISETEMIISGSSDLSVRLWTISGRYIGILGSPVVWNNIISADQLQNDFKFRMPPDLKGKASSTTLKVLNGGETEQYTAVFRQIDKTTEKAEITVENKKMFALFGEPLTEPILGKHFHLPPRSRHFPKPVLDKSLPYIPVYSHLEIHETPTIDEPATPEVLLKARALQFTGIQPSSTLGK